MNLEKPLMLLLPKPDAVRYRLGDVLREVKLLRSLLRMSERVQRYRQCDREYAKREAAANAN
jgi:hypothetical protein